MRQSSAWIRALANTTGVSAPTACFGCGRRRRIGVSPVWEKDDHGRMGSGAEIADCRGQAPRKPPYQVHIPLAMLPGVGPITYGKLLREVGTELEILYHASLDEISRAAGSRLPPASVSLGRAAFISSRGRRKIRKGNLEGNPDPVEWTCPSLSFYCIIIAINGIMRAGVSRLLFKEEPQHVIEPLSQRRLWKGFPLQSS